MHVEKNAKTQLPAVIEPLALARRDAVLQGQLQASDMPRLQAGVEKAEHPVWIDWQCYLDAGGRALITGTAQTTVELQCRRCLQTFPWQLETQTRLAALRPGEDISVLPEEFEPLDIAAEQVSLLELVEEDILLALPLFAAHEQCPDNEYIDENAPTAEIQAMETAGTQKPFAGLQALKKPN